MFGDKFSLPALLRNAKKMQQMMENTQEELAKIQVVGESGAGAVKIYINARHMVSKVEIEDDIMKEDKVILQDLVAAAINNASSKIDEITKNKMMDAGKLFGGLVDKEEKETETKE
jgi:nucleoid-associated protein EbfC